MKIVGKNSLSRYISFFLYFAYIIFLFHLLYFIIGVSICSLNYSHDVNIFPEIFSVERKLYHENYLANMFVIKFPFSEQNFFNGELKWRTIITASLGFAFLTYFFYSSFRIFKNLSSEIIFTENTIRWLQRFAYANVIAGFLFIIFWYFVWHLINPTELIFYSLFLFLLGGTFLYLAAFFKKGHELQTENDLTI